MLLQQRLSGATTKLPDPTFIWPKELSKSDAKRINHSKRYTQLSYSIIDL